MWLLFLLGADAGQQWTTRTEGAAVKVRVQAQALAETAAAVAAAGRIERLAPLRAHADELVRQSELLARWAKDPPKEP